jgi:phosphatidylinositol glycan class B
MHTIVDKRPAFRVRELLAERTLLALLALAMLVRLAAIAAFPSLHHPDENFQLFEQAHRIAFGYGIVPWEFRDGIRSPVLPYVLAGVFWLGERVIGGPEGYLLLARSGLAATSLLAVAAVYRMGRRTSATHALMAGLVAATWFELVYFAGRPLTEAVATTFLLVGLALASVPQERFSFRRLVAIGFCLGLALMLRFHLGPGLLVAAVWVGARDLRTRWWPST